MNQESIVVVVVFVLFQNIPACDITCFFLKCYQKTTMDKCTFYFYCSCKPGEEWYCEEKKRCGQVMALEDGRHYSKCLGEKGTGAISFPQGHYLFLCSRCKSLAGGWCPVHWEMKRWGEPPGVAGGSATESFIPSLVSFQILTLKEIHNHRVEENVRLSSHNPLWWFNPFCL